MEAQKNLQRGSQRPKSLSHPDTSHITSSKAILVALGLRCFTCKWEKGWKGFHHISDFQTVPWGPSKAPYKF